MSYYFIGENMNKELKVLINPKIKTYPITAYYISILEGNNINIQSLIKNKFIHIFFHKDRLDFVNSEFLFDRVIDKDLIELSYDNIIDNIKNYINDDNYVVIIINEQMISNPRIHKDYEYVHDRMIYGYDDEKQVFMTIGYVGCNIKMQTYDIELISYSEMELAIKSTLNKKYNKWLIPNHICRVPNHIPVFYDSYKTVCKELKKFISLINIENHKKKYILTDRLAQRLLIISLIIKSIKKEDVDIRTFRIIYENKKIIHSIIKDYSNNKRIIKAYSKIVDDSYMNLLLCCKYNNDKKKELHKIIKRIIVNNIKEIWWIRYFIYIK